MLSDSDLQIALALVATWRFNRHAIHYWMVRFEAGTVDKPVKWLFFLVDLTAWWLMFFGVFFLVGWVL